MYVTNASAAEVAKLANKKKPGRASASGFSELLSSGEVEEQAETSGTSSVSSANSLLFMQEINDEDQQKKEAVSQGFDALKYLDNIKMGLLFGTLPKATIMNLESLLQKFRKNFTDPHLSQIIDEIELRAKVEIAKIESN